MSYVRVLPRDLFNDSNLLKCIGKLVLDIEDGMLDLSYEHINHRMFDIWQHESDGSTHIVNIDFYDNQNNAILFNRPLNSRKQWPLICDISDNEFNVFEEDGSYTKEFLDCFGVKKWLT